MRRKSTLAVLGLLCVAAAAAPETAAAASTVKPVEYSVQISTGSILDLTAGPDGAVWFTEKQAATIGRITPKGVVHLYPLPSPMPGYAPPQVSTQWQFSDLDHRGS